MTRCFAYIRVSTAKQRDHGVSLEAQREAIERYARVNALTITEWFHESQTAAKRGRAEFNRMLTLLRERKADGVIIHKIDRSARNLRDWADFAELVDRGVSIHLAAEALDLTSRGGRLSADIQAVVAADFIRNLRQESLKGIRGRYKQGLLPGWAPVGYEDNGAGKPKTIDPVLGPLVRELFERYATGAYTLVEISEAMTQLGLVNKRGNPITKNSVARMLRQRFYIGLIEVARTGEVFEGVHEPLVTKALFDQVQTVLAGTTRPKKTKHEFVFRRLLTCGLCGSRLIGELQKGNVYYRCHTKDCETTSAREDAVEAALLDELAKMTLAPGLRRDCETVFARYQSERHTLASNSLSYLQLEVAKVKERLDRLTDLMIDGVLDPTTYNEKKRRLLESKKGFEEEIDHVVQNPEVLAQRVHQILEQAETAPLSYKTASPYVKREIVEITTSNRVVRPENVSIELRPPFCILAERHVAATGDPHRDEPRTFEHTSWLVEQILEFVESELGGESGSCSQSTQPSEAV